MTALHILVIDDDPTVRLILKAMLESHGFSVETVDNGTAGVAALNPETAAVPRTSLVILDMMMPDMTGLEVLDRIRNDLQLGQLPVLMLSAENKPDDIARGYEAGADVYMTKPFTRDELVHMVQQTLRDRGLIDPES